MRTPIWSILAFATYCPNQKQESITIMITTAMINEARNGMSPEESSTEVGVVIDGLSHAAHPGERLVDLVNRMGLKLPQVCYHPQLGPIQTCDTCLVEINGQ